MLSFGQYIFYFFVRKQRNLPWVGQFTIITFKSKAFWYKRALRKKSFFYVISRNFILKIVVQIKGQARLNDQNQYRLIGSFFNNPKLAMISKHSTYLIEVYFLKFDCDQQIIEFNINIIFNLRLRQMFTKKISFLI